MFFKEGDYNFKTWVVKGPKSRFLRFSNFFIKNPSKGRKTSDPAEGNLGLI